MICEAPASMPCLYASGRRGLLALALALLALAGSPGLHAQDKPAQSQPAPASANPKVTPADSEVTEGTPGLFTNPDAGYVGGPQTQKSVPELQEEAWTILTNAVTVSKNSQTRIQGLGALGLMGSTPRALDLIEKMMADKDVDVRTAAALAAGQTRAPEITTPLRAMLDDKEPQVAFGAAVALWKLGDRSGEDILMAVVDGQRHTAPGPIEGAMHDASKDLHSPATLARMGAMQGASMLLGPFGIGMTAYEYLHKNGGDSARVTAIEEIAENHTLPIRNELMAAVEDKDFGVRAASAKALARYHEPEVALAIAKLFYDEKPPVRFTGAAAYLICTNAAVASLDPNAPKAAPVAAVAKKKHG